MRLSPEQFAVLVKYSNQKTTPEENMEVEAMLENNPQAAIELESIISIKRSLRESDDATPGEFGLARLMRDLDREGEQNDRRSKVNRFYAVAAVLLVALGGIAVFRYQSAQPGSSQYVSAAGPTSGDIQLRFNASAKQAVINQILQENGSQIVSGPSAVGAYRIRVQAGRDIDVVVATLRARADVFEFVEREP